MGGLNLKNGDRIELTKFGSKFYYEDGNGAWTEFPVAAASVGSYPEGTKIYRALISQEGLDAPTAVVLQNTLGETPTFSRSATGYYTLNVVGNLFTSSKVMLSADSVLDFTITIGLNKEGDNQIGIYVAEDRVPIDDIPISNVPIEILVFP